MHAENFFEIAKTLLKTPTEAAYRTAINRAYYATFHAGATFLAELGFKTSDGPQAHRQLPARINNCGIPELQGIHTALYDLYSRGRQADYNLNSPNFRTQALAALDVASADQMIAAVKRCQQSQDLRLQIRNGIREYERKINP